MFVVLFYKIRHSTAKRIQYKTKFILLCQNVTTDSLLIYLFYTSCEPKIVYVVSSAIKNKKRFHVPNLYKTHKPTNFGLIEKTMGIHSLFHLEISRPCTIEISMN